MRIIKSFAATSLAVVWGMLWALACQAQAVDSQTQTLRLAIASEPPTLNSLVSTNSESFFVLGHIMEGLMQYDAQQQLVGGVAKRWQLADTGARFWLRRDAHWSDGKPVTAHDFVFAWRQALRPQTASQYAFIFFPIRNAEQVHRGELPAEALAVRAVNDHELVVEFARPCPYFLNLTAFMSYYPVREDVFTRDPSRYAAELDDMVYNGAFRLTRWVHGAHLTLSKNPHYWNRQAVTLNTIDIPFITADPGAVFNLFQDGQVALSALGSETLGQAIARGFEVQQFATGAQYYLSFNFRPERPTANWHIRRAIQAIFDPRTLVNKVLANPAHRPGESLFPTTVKGVTGWFRDEYPAPKVSRGLAIARQHIAAAKEQLGGELPPLVLLAGDSPRAAREAEYLQYLLQQGLGLMLKIDAQMFKQYLEKMRRGQYDIAIAGWGPDFDDAITFGDLFASWNANNRGQYRSEQYDYWVRQAQQSSDQALRMAAMNELQQIIANDVVMIPTFEAGSLYVQHPRLKGVVRRQFGADPDFKFAHIEAAP